MRKVALLAFSVISESASAFSTCRLAITRPRATVAVKAAESSFWTALRAEARAISPKDLAGVEFVVMVSSPLLFSGGPEGFGVLDMAFPCPENLNFQMRVGRNPLPISRYMQAQITIPS